MFWFYKGDLMLRVFIVVFLLILNAGCGVNAPDRPALVVKAIASESESRKVYRVMAKDTLYSIAWAYNQDISELIKINNLKKDGALVVGQKLVIPKLDDIVFKGSLPILRSAKHSLSTTPVIIDEQIPIEKKRVVVVKKGSKTKIKTVDFSKKSLANKRSGVRMLRFSKWSWPHARTEFAAPPWRGIWVYTNKVQAMAPGTVVYNSSGIKGYGHLIIVKHAQGVLSAYGNVVKSQVKIGQRVKVKQLLAYAHKRVYVEVRKQGKAINLHNYF